MGTLYIVATPIGNMEDITVRAAKILTEVKVIACEDTRRTGLLLDHLRKTYIEHPEVVEKPRLISFYEQNEEQRIPELIALLKQGEDIALVSDAGTPGISDPGFTIVREAQRHSLKVRGIPGASSVILALITSGLPTDKFSFYGYLPDKTGNARKMLENIAKSSEIVSTTHIIFEAPHKLHQTLILMKEILGDKEIVLCRELTKTHEETMKGTISKIQKDYETREPKGEMILLWH